MSMETAETIDSLRVHVRRGLDRFCLGQYFTEYGLQETVKLIPDDVDTNDLEGSGLMDKKCPFQVFLKAVASEIVKEKGVTKGRKKRIKDYVEILQAFSSEWVDYIRKNMRKKKQQTQIKNKPPLGSPDPAGGDGTTPLKKKGKRGPRGPYKKRKQSAAAAASSSPTMSTTPSPSKRQKVAPPQDIDSARQQFEQEREEVSSKIPNKNKKLFNQVGFAKWGKTSLPAMALDPYSVPPGDIREQWMKMFQNVVQKDRISKMGHLVWWIGPDTGGQSSYSVVPNHGFMTYEEGQKKNMHELPAKIKKLLDRGSELNKTQMETVEALRILNELALQPKEEREHPRSDFMEEDYWGLDDEGEEEDRGGAAAAAVAEELVDDKEEEEEEEDDEDDDDEEELLDDSSLEESSKKSKKKSKKRKKDQIIVEDEDHTEIVYDDIEEVMPVASSGPPKKRKKKDGKKKRKKKKSMDGDDKPDDQQPTADESGEGKDMDVARAPSPDQAAIDEASVDSGDSALVDSDYGDEFGDTDEQDDPTISSKKKDKLKKKGSKKKDKAPKEEKDKKSKKKKKNKDKDKDGAEPKKRSKAAEQRDLEMCEQEYLPFIEKLEMAKDKRDIATIQEVLEQLLPVAESFAASFFSEYEIPQIMKATKSVLEAAEDGDLSTYRKLWNKMKNSYAQKFKEFPEGFKGKKRKSVKTPAKDSSERGSEDEPSEKALSVKDEGVKPQGSPVRPPDDVSSAMLVPDTAKSKDKAATPASPPMKVPIKDGKRRASAGSEQLKKAAEPPAPKAKEKFSILGLLSKKKDSSKRQSVGGGSEKSSTTPSSAPSKKTVPSWVTSPLPTSFDSFIDDDRRDDRMFALEFLLQAAAHFPPNKGVNEESVARSLEMAIYEWSQSQRGSWTDNYWDKVHALVAAITGKRDVGTLVDLIMDGSFPSPSSLMKLSVENLEHSFEGRPIMLSGE